MCGRRVSGLEGGLSFPQCQSPFPHPLSVCILNWPGSSPDANDDVHDGPWQRGADEYGTSVGCIVHGLADDGTSALITSTRRAG